MPLQVSNDDLGQQFLQRVEGPGWRRLGLSGVATGRRRDLVVVFGRAVAGRLEIWVLAVQADMLLEEVVIIELPDILAQVVFLGDLQFKCKQGSNELLELPGFVEDLLNVAVV